MKVLKDVALSDSDLKRLKPYMTNWLRVHAYLVTLPDSEPGMRELKKMLLYEIRTRRRLDVVARVYARMAKLRTRLEQQELFNAL